MNCPFCGKKAVKSGKVYSGGLERQRYLCKYCIKTFTDGPKITLVKDTFPCPKCGEKASKYGTRIVKGERKQKWQCKQCGYIFTEK